MKMKLMPKVTAAMDRKNKLVFNNWHKKIGFIIRINMQIIHIVSHNCLK